MPSIRPEKRKLQAKLTMRLNTEILNVLEDEAKLAQVTPAEIIRRMLGERLEVKTKMSRSPRRANILRQLTPDAKTSLELLNLIETMRHEFHLLSKRVDGLVKEKKIDKQEYDNLVDNLRAIAENQIAFRNLLIPRSSEDDEASI